MRTFWRVAPWLNRLLLLLPTAIFVMIGTRYMLNPIGEAASRQITLPSPDAISTVRIGFGAFPLAFAILTLACLVSTRRLLLGLQLVTTIVGVATAVRAFGILVDGAGVESLRLLRVEAVLLALFVTGHGGEAADRTPGVPARAAQASSLS